MIKARKARVAGGQHFLSAVDGHNQNSIGKKKQELKVMKATLLGSTGHKSK